MSSDDARIDPFLEIIIVTYKRTKQLRSLVASLSCQTNMGFSIKIIHDGPSGETRECVLELQELYPELILFYEESEKRFNDYGHSLRSKGVQDATQEYCLLTNDDNYYVPIFIDEISKTIQQENPDIIYFDMVHNYRFEDLPNPVGYQTLITEPRIDRIDMGSFIFRTQLGKSIGFTDRSYKADGVFFEALTAVTTNIVKIPKVLFVHN